MGTDVVVATRARCRLRRDARDDDDDDDDASSSSSSSSPSAIRRRELALGATAGVLLPPASASAATGAPPAIATTEPDVTHVVFLDVALCDANLRADRAMGGGGGALCENAAPLGRVEIGLYGDAVPTTVANFLALIPPRCPPGDGYVRTVFHRVKKGEYVLAGAPGSNRLGQTQIPTTRANDELAPGVEPPTFQRSNPDALNGRALSRRHFRPGTVSLALGAAVGGGDGGFERASPTEFLITTGPGPAPSLDGENVVFGRVLRGLDVVAAIADVPTFKPSGNSIAWNQVAEWFGDDRAAKARAVWTKPTKAIVIENAGVLSAP